MSTARSDQARRRVCRARKAASGLLLRECGDPGDPACWQVLDAISPSPPHPPDSRDRSFGLAAPARPPGHSVALPRLAVALIVVGLLAGVVTLAAGLAAGALGVALPASDATPT